MTTPLQEARSAVDKARLALGNGDRRQARLWAERATKLAPSLEDAWLILAAVAGPQQGLEYIRKALQVNPQSARAQRGMEWVMQHLREVPPPVQTPASTARRPSQSRGPSVAASNPAAEKVQRRRGPALAIVLLVVGAAILTLAGWTAVTSPVVASMLPRPVLESQPTPAPEWSQVSIPKPTYTAAAVVEVPVTATPTATPTATDIPTETASPQESTVFADPSTASTEPSTTLSTDLPTATEEVAAVEGEAPTPEPEWTGELTMDYVADTPTSEAPPYVPPPAAADMGNGEHWIDVNLSQQMLYAYAGDTVVNSFLVSTGTWLTPTVTGKFRIWIKLRSSDMSGPGYYLPAVPYVMYFYKDYGLHGTYWHNNFGTPMSHGCVNLSIPDAEWVYNFTTEGTVVNVHY